MRENEYLNTVFHLTPRIPSRNKIEIIGILHGSIGGPPRKYRQYLYKTLREYEGDIYTEGRAFNPISRKLNNIMMLPTRMTLKPIKPVEPSEISKLLVHGSLNIALNELKSKPLFKITRGLLRQTLKSLKQNFKEKMKTKVKDAFKVSYTPPEKNYNKYYKEIYNLAPKEIRFIVNFRSLVMAGRILKESRTSNKPMTLVCGKAHAGQIHNFLEKPELALKYIQVSKDRIESLQGQREYPLFNTLLQKAEEEFKLLKNEQNSKE